jgi:hypothetical protein
VHVPPDALQHVPPNSIVPLQQSPMSVAAMPAGVQLQTPLTLHEPEQQSLGLPHEPPVPLQHVPLAAQRPA